MKQRMVFIDVAKAIGIFLICLGHFLPSATMPKVAIYSFHVPLFFFVAGLLNTESITSAKQYFSKQKSMFVRTIIPYIIWFILSLPGYLLEKDWSIREVVRCFFFLDGHMIWNAPLWFLPSYFLVISIFRLLHMLTSGSKIKLSLCCIVAFGCSIVFDKMDIPVSLFGLDKGVHMLGYTLLGYVFRDIVYSEVANRKKASKYLLLFGLFMFFASYVNNQNNISILGLDYNEIIIFIPMACVLSISFVISCSLIPKSYILNLVAKNTCFIMASHYFPLMVIHRLTSELTIIIGIICAVFLFCGYIVLLILLDKQLLSTRFRHYLTFAGIQLNASQKCKTV